MVSKRAQKVEMACYEKAQRRMLTSGLFPCTLAPPLLHAAAEGGSGGGQQGLQEWDGKEGRGGSLPPREPNTKDVNSLSRIRRRVRPDGDGLPRGDAGTGESLSSEAEHYGIRSLGLLWGDGEQEGR